MVALIVRRSSEREKFVFAPSLNPRIKLQLLLFVFSLAPANVEGLLSIQEVSAAVVNISGRQRMLSQRAALFALRLSVASSASERNLLRDRLEGVLALMEESHYDLIAGNSTLNLPGKLSEAIRKIYEEAPYQLNRRIREFLEAGKRLLRAPEGELKGSNPDLIYLLEAAETDFLDALDAAVTQYQTEKEEQERAIDLCQVKLYKETRTAMAVAQSRSQELSETVAQLQKTQIQLLQADKLSSLGQLVAGVAHEINNPLGFISGNIQYVETYITDLLGILALYQQQYPQTSPAIQKASDDVELDYLIEDLPESIKMMQVGVERIKEVVLNLRNFSRLDDTKPTAIALEDCVNSTLKILRYRFKNAACKEEIKVILDFAKLPEIECYPGQISQVLMNLIANAIDALGEAKAKPELTLKTGLMPSNPEWIEIRIADNGKGMAEEVKQNLFSPFFTTKPRGQGTGLGLSICKQIIVERHGGNLECRSHPGEGTEFTIQLPIRQPSQS